MAQRKSGSKSSSRGAGGARKSSAKPAGGGSKTLQSGFQEVLKDVDIDDAMVQEWRDRVREFGSNVDVKKSLEAAKKMASSSSATIRKAGGKNPALFYGGLAALVAGASMMTAAHTGRKAAAAKQASKAKAKKR